MSSYIDNEKLIDVLKNYYNVTHIRIAILDTDYKDIEGYPKKRASLCQYIRTSKLADENCRACDRKACQISKQTNAVYMYKCHAGLYEIIEPLIVNGIVVGYLFFAHMLSGLTYDEAIKDIIEKTKNYKLDQEILTKLIKDSTLLKIDYIKSAAKLLETIAIYLCMEKMSFLKTFDNLPILVNKYIYSHIEENISIEDICSAVNVGKTKLYQTSKKYFNSGIHEHIRYIRLEKAKEILINEKNTSVYDVAQRCGFEDYNYFIHIFKQIVGTTPKKFFDKYNSDSINEYSTFLS